MSPNSQQNPSKSLIYKSKLYSFILYLVITLTIFPQKSNQQNVPGLCVFEYDSLNRYTCNLFNAVSNSPDMDIEITGDHLAGRSDIDVLAVVHHNASIFTFNGEILRKFTNLRFIDMRSSRLLSFAENSFENCSSLEELDVSFNEIWTLQRRMFRNCHNLRVFRADVNRITSITDDFFGNTNSLEIFSLFSNRLTTFPDNLLVNMRNLRIFNVQSNSITEISRNNLMNAVNLEEINISGNLISNATNVLELINGHRGLKVLRLDSNRLQSFSFDIFGQFQLLEVFTFSLRSEIVNMSWQSLASSIRILGIFNIGEDISSNAFTRMRNLTSLSISGNGITQLYNTSFSGLRELEMIRIVNTRIRVLPEGLFIDQGKLKDLILDSNEIELLPDGIFTPLSQIGADNHFNGLRLFGNRIQRLSLSMFGQHPHLRNIQFSNNNISAIQRGIFGRMASNIIFVDFTNNECTSSAFWNVTNLDQELQLEWCFISFEGITTTEIPDGCGINYRRSEILGIIFINVFIVLRNWIR